jgi:subtilisin
MTETYIPPLLPPKILPPEVVVPDEPVYELPPNEQQPELSIRADLLAESRDWSHTNLAIAPLFDRGLQGEGAVIAICDTGIDVDHPDLKNRVVTDGNKDFTGSPSGFKDGHSHGTHCAGIAAASSDGNGIIGVAPAARVMAVKVLSDTGSGRSSWIANGIRHAADKGADIISLSLGGPGQDPTTRAAIQYAISKGCWVVVAAGNDGREVGNYPGHFPESCAVAATDKEDKRATFSTIHAENDIAAPGVSIMSTLPDGRYGTMSGTSMATPAVAGCLAIVRAELKRLGQAIPTQTQMLSALKKTAKDLGAPGIDKQYGAGLIDTEKLLFLLLGPVEPPPPPPPPPPTGDRMLLTLNGKTESFALTRI